MIAPRDVVENYAQLSPSFVCQGMMAGTCFIYLLNFFLLHLGVMRRAALVVGIFEEDVARGTPTMPKTTLYACTISVVMVLMGLVYHFLFLLSLAGP